MSSLSTLMKRVLGALASHFNLVFYSFMAAVGLLAIVYFFWAAPIHELNLVQAQINAKEYMELRNNIRTGLAQAVGGSAILIGLFFTWRTTRVTERNLRITQESVRATQENAYRSLQISQEGQITERFTRAIEQIGSDRLEIRLGGIYALERIAGDSEKDRWPVVEVLTAFIREHAQWRGTQEEESSTKPRTDVQAILSVVAKIWADVGKHGERIDLCGTNIRGARIIGGHFERAYFWDAHLDGANLRDAHLEDAGLRRAHLNGTALIEAHLERAKLFEAQMEEADLTGAHMQGAQLNGACLRRADLHGADLLDSNLLEANLEGANLTNASLRGAIMKKANLRGADLRGADLTNTDGLTAEQVSGAHNHDKATLPQGLMLNQNRE
jgi:uncharacterized protein YjbI with pentapeptide repeats